MGLVLNLIVQTIVWFGFMGVIIFSAAGTLNYAGGWLYLGEMVAMTSWFSSHSCSSCSEQWASWQRTLRVGTGQ